MNLKGFRGIWPSLGANVFIAEGVTLIGDVQIGAESSVWFGTLIRGDVNYVTIGERTNIQDGVVIHVTRGVAPTIIGNGVTVAHCALLHGCTLHDGSFIGMGATVMDGAVVETGGWVAAGALVSPGKTVPRGEIWAGVPARFLRKVTPDEARYIKTSSNNYVDLAREYLAESSS